MSEILDLFLRWQEESRMHFCSTVEHLNIFRN